MCTCKSTIL